jgi:threonylcarbamoyladenosine tRNA methylthiotransferase CDKAL1
MVTVTTELERLPDIEELFLQSSPSTDVERRTLAATVGNVRHADCAAAASETVGDDAAHAEAALQPQVPGTQRLWIRTFGCSHNISDSEYMAGMLQQVGNWSDSTAEHALEHLTADGMYVLV